MTETININTRLADMAGLEPNSLDACIANYALETGDPAAFLSNLDRFQCGDELLTVFIDYDRCKAFFDDYYEDIQAALFDLRLDGNLPEIDIESDLRSWLGEIAFFARARRMASDLDLIDRRECDVLKCATCGERKSSIRFNVHDPRCCLICIAEASETNRIGTASKSLEIDLHTEASPGTMPCNDDRIS